MQKKTSEKNKIFIRRDRRALTTVKDQLFALLIVLIFTNKLYNTDRG